MEKLHVINQSKEDYDREQRTKDRLLIIISWYIVCAFLFSLPVYFMTQSFDLQITTVVIFLLIFVFAEFLSGRIKSILKIIISAFYIFWGAFFILVGIMSFIMPEQYIYMKLITAVIAFGIAALFLYLAYKDIDRYTNLIKVLRNKM